MNIREMREWLNDHSGMAIGICVPVILCIWGLSAFVFNRATRSHEPVFPTRRTYSSDDGATWFADDESKVPPFDHGGQEAVRAYVFSCDHGRHTWVQYLEKYDDYMHRQMLLFQAHQPVPKDVGPLSGLLVRKPGATAWVPKTSAEGEQIIKPKCPDGSQGIPELVIP